MPNVFKNFSCQLFCGNAEELFSNIENNTIDAIVTDPPAGINFFGNNWDNPAFYNTFKQNGTNRDAFIDWIGKIFSLCHKASKQNATLVTWTLPKTSHWTARALQNNGWHIKEEFYHVFGTGQTKSRSIEQDILKITKDESFAKTWKGWGTALKPCYEKWLVAQKMPCSDIKSNFFYSKKVGGSERQLADKCLNEHPALKTLDLMSYIIRTYTKLGDTILDPFMGSGTTGAAAIQLNRLFVGFEEIYKYFEIAIQRVKNAAPVAHYQDLEF